MCSSLVMFPVVNVYTTHMPEISTTLPRIIMQDESSVLNNSASNSDLALPPETYSLIGEDIITHSFVDDDDDEEDEDESSSDEQSDVEIDL